MSFLTWIGRFLDNLLTGQLSVLLPVIGLGIAFGIIGFAISKIKSLTWGF